MNSHQKRPAKRAERVAKQLVEIAHIWQRSVDSVGKLEVRRHLATSRVANRQVGKIREETQEGRLRLAITTFLVERTFEVSKNTTFGEGYIPIA